MNKKTKITEYNNFYSKFGHFLFYFIALLIGFNFLLRLNVGLNRSVPVFQFIILLITIALFLNILINYSGSLTIPRLNGVQYYKYYLIFSLVSLLIAILFNTNALIIYIYGFLPFILFLFTYKNMKKSFFNKILIVVNISMLLITIIGWLTRLGIVPLDFFYWKASLSQYQLGYWGIRYAASTRNGDYIYPLVGLAISSYLFLLKNKNLLHSILYLILIFIYALTLLASLSRAAIIIALFCLIYIFILSKKKQRIIIIFFLFLIAMFDYKFIIRFLDFRYMTIIKSIFLNPLKYNNHFSNYDRLEILKDGILASILNPIGYGIGNYKSIYHIWEIHRNFNSNKTGEDNFLTILIERGWVVFLFYILMFISVLKKTFNSSKITFNKIFLPLLIIYFLFNYELHNIFVNMLFYIILMDYYLISKEVSNEQL